MLLSLALLYSSRDWVMMQTNREGQCSHCNHVGFKSSGSLGSHILTMRLHRS